VTLCVQAEMLQTLQAVLIPLQTWDTSDLLCSRLSQEICMWDCRLDHVRALGHSDSNDV